MFYLATLILSYVDKIYHAAATIIKIQNHSITKMFPALLL